MSRLRFFSVFAVSYGVEVCHKCSSHCLSLNNGQTLGTFQTKEFISGNASKSLCNLGSEALKKSLVYRWCILFENWLYSL